METRHRRGAALPDGRASSERGGDRVRRAEPNAGAGTPRVRPHHITRNTGWAQCARTPDPCNKVSPPWSSANSAASPRRRDFEHPVTGQYPESDTQLAGFSLRWYDRRLVPAHLKNLKNRPKKLGYPRDVGQAISLWNDINAKPKRKR